MRTLRSTPAPVLPLAVALALGACAPEASLGDSAAPDLLRDAPSAGEASDVAPTGPNFAALGKDNRAFAFDLYRQLASESPAANLVFSPYSISSALAMAYAGARGTTLSEMKSALHFALPSSTLHASFEAVAAQLAARGRGLRGADGTPFRLNVGSALWVQRDLTVEPAFLDTLRAHYDAAPVSLDFQGAPEPSRATINAHIAKDTEGLFQELLPAGTISPLTRLVLTNTVYFNAGWQVRFEPKATADAPFTKLDGKQVAAALMNLRSALPFAQGEGYRAVAIPYANEALRFVAVLPDAGKLAQIEAGMGQIWFDTLRANLRSVMVQLSLPKLDYRAKASLPSTLAALGMRTPFTDAADFSGMARGPLYLSDVIHEAVIQVLEGGTIAAAATAAVINTRSALPRFETVVFDRPFLYAVVDEPTGQVLFLGRVTDPTAR